MAKGYIYLFIYLSGNVCVSGKGRQVSLVKGNRFRGAAEGTQQRMRTYLLVLLPLGSPPPQESQAGPYGALPALRVREALHHRFLNEHRFCPACHCRNWIRTHPAGCEAEGPSRARGWQVVPARSWPPHIQEVSPSLPFSACTGPVCDRTGPGE